jgi:hypothetical protein
MSADLTSPGCLRAFAIDLRARRYRDPIEKLAYLRRATHRAASRKRPHVSWYAKTMMLLLVFLGVRLETVMDVNAGLPRAKPGPEVAAPVARAPGLVWLVENGKEHEVYSNGLRIENQYTSPSEPRSYVLFLRGTISERHSNPAGIVFHTSESLQAPFVSTENENLTRIGRDLLEYVSRHRAYNFLIDRFGRVFRIVPETDSANHAGYSVWADQDGAYVNLNHSFLGVSFEARTRDLDLGNYLSPSQVHSGRLLVEMLVSKYRIRLANCITHAQVSVNPDSMTIGHHTDGTGDFPFQGLGVPDNYGLPVPSLYMFGFDFDSRFLELAGPRMRKGLLLADEQLRRDANTQHLSLDRHREILRENYRTSIARLKTLGIIKEN